MKSWIKVLASVFPVSLAKTLAMHIVTRNSLNWCPNYIFGQGNRENKPWLYWLRMQLWRYGKIKKCQISIKWFEDITIDIPLGTDLGLCLFVDGMYDPNELMFLSQILKPGMHFVDVGANIGLYSLFASKKVKNSGRVTSFEPSQREFLQLLHHININNVKNVSTYHIGLADRHGEADLRIASSDHSGHNTLGNFSYPTVREISVERVPLESLDNIVIRDNFPKIDVIKIDVEGSEFFVLNGAKTVLDQHRPIILLELLEPALQQQGKCSQYLLDLLNVHGYDIYYFDKETGHPLINQGQLATENIIAAPHEWVMPI